MQLYCRLFKHTLRPHVLDTSLDEGYRAMAADKEREAEAREWGNALAKDMADEAR